MNEDGGLAIYYYSTQYSLIRKAQTFVKGKISTFLKFTHPVEAAVHIIAAAASP